MKNILIVASSLTLAACSSSTTESESNVQHEVTLPFVAEANGTAIDCDVELTGLGAENSNARISDFRLYVHDVTFVGDDSERYALELDESDWQNDNVALLDFTNKTSSCSGDTKDTNTEIVGRISAPENVNITSVEFYVGVPSRLNHADTVSAAAPLNITSLHWNWQKGYKHMRLDISPIGGVNDGASTNWNFHLGSTGCTGSPQLGEDVTCTNENRAFIELSDFDLDINSVLIDYEALIAAEDVTSDLGGPAGCMSGATDPECASLFNALGMDISSGQPDVTLTQTVFKLQ